jgi:hypothetical protein
MDGSIFYRTVTNYQPAGKRTQDGNSRDFSIVVMRPDVPRVLSY